MKVFKIHDAFPQQSSQQEASREKHRELTMQLLTVPQKQALGEVVAAVTEPEENMIWSFGWVFFSYVGITSDP